MLCRWLRRYFATLDFDRRVVRASAESECFTSVLYVVHISVLISRLIGSPDILSTEV